MRFSGVRRELQTNERDLRDPVAGISRYLNTDVGSAAEAEGTGAQGRSGFRSVKGRW